MLNPRRLLPDDITLPILGEQIVVPVGAVALTTIPENADFAEICVNDNALRMTLDGTTPLATKGALVSAGENFVLAGAEIKAALLIRVASDTDIWVNYYKY